MTTTTLDAAIEAGKAATWPELGFPSVGESIDQIDRTYARSLISHLFENVKPPEDSTCYEVDLFEDAKRALLRVAGLEDLA